MTRAPALADAAPLDGRRRRGQDNRARIVAAMMQIVQGGEVAPSAEQVAALADVGLRTVFRHFQDMDSLYREMARVMEAEVRLILDPPMQANDWRGRLAELIARRAQVFEKIAPFRRAADAFRHRSKFLGSDYARLVVQLREGLAHVLPKDIAAAPAKVEALDLLMSFEAWARLRREQQLSPEAAQRVVEQAVAAVVDA
ncbi:TetR/AcrR family transcriptional regulator [Phenylobacterium sp.]|uniref:TetR/AcrR family transcriptional regulator n=1 Tax=Phenylobacterium sp. TaxID=1871053 RepID=UPI0025EC0F0A|nr:TetR/AcrR family transcriptional regulator [Phenylobacterium sp.]